MGFIRKEGGRCTLKEIVRALNLNKKGSREEDDRAVTILKEFATVDQAANSPVLVLAEQYMKDAQPEKKLNDVQQPTRQQEQGQPFQQPHVVPIRENVVATFAARLGKRNFASVREASDYLVKKDGLKEPEIAEILRRF